MYQLCQISNKNHLRILAPIICAEWRAEQREGAGLKKTVKVNTPEV